MYYWQTRVLAELETGPEITDAQHKAVRQFLYDIGLKHFQLPVVEYDPLSSDRRLVLLQWDVDDRRLVARVDPFGRVDAYLYKGDEPLDNRLFLLLPIKKKVRWLLVGDEAAEEPQPLAEAASRKSPFTPEQEEYLVALITEKHVWR